MMTSVVYKTETCDFGLQRGTHFRTYSVNIRRYGPGYWQVFWSFHRWFWMVIRAPVPEKSTRCDSYEYGVHCQWDDEAVWWSLMLHTWRWHFSRERRAHS